MPPRWPRQPDRADPAYRKLDDRMNFAVHVALFAAINSGLWFFRVLKTTPAMTTPAGLPGTGWLTASWAAVLVAHALYIFAIAKYDGPQLFPVNGAGGQGFQPKSEETGKKTSKSPKG